MAKLYYFNGRGRGEIIRLTLGACGVEFTEELLTERSQLLKLISDEKLMFNQVPLLEIDGKCLIQANSIVRYLGRKYGLAGRNEDEAVLIDEIFEGGRDFFTPLLPIGFRPEADVLADVQKKTLPKYMPLFEKIAAKNGTGFLVGDSLTLADLSLLEALLMYVEYLGTDIFKDYPALKKFYDTVSSVDKVAAFINGPQRKRKNDEKYISEVKTVLDW